MNKSNIAETDRENESFVQLCIYRAPKKNHDAMIKLSKQWAEFFRKYGILRYEVFHINNTETAINDVNIAETVLASKDEEVWVEILYFKDKKHQKEVEVQIKNDKSCEPLYQQYIELITQGSRTIMGEFSRLNV